MNRNHKGIRKGFTLLEILLVIATIGILAAIVLVAINPTRQINQVRQAAINSDKNTIEKALQQRLIDTGQYPTGLDGVQRIICSNGNTPPNCLDLSGLIPDYVAAIPSSTTYTVARGSDGRVYVNTTETASNLTCPTGYIKVPGNSLYQTKDFCVMKYEAKTGSATVAATTQVAGLPRVNISQTDAITSCSLNGAGYALISNAEWMTIARNIEAQSINWRNGIIGSTDASGGGLWRGHGDNNPPNSLSANIDDNLGYEGTGNSSPSNQKRTHTLSNGEVIWDLGGNVWELTNDIVLGKDQPTGGSTGFNWRQYNTGQSDSVTNFGTLSRDLVGPSNGNWGITHNMGRIYSDGTVTNNDIYALRRGGNWGSNTDTSIFTVALNTSQSEIGNVTGFRCVVR